ncbi:MAG: M14 family zinc carboxypeptidase, partial [Luteimonas sp.]
MADWLIRRRAGSARCLAGLLFALVLALVPAAHADVRVAQVQAQELVPQQARGEWRFDEDGIAFDNVGEGARLAGVVRRGPGQYRVVVVPETTPINPSPWYAFRIVASRAGRAGMVFDYGQFKHRYRPWLRWGGSRGSWRAATEAEFSVDADDVATLSLQVEAGDVVEVSAQVPIRTAEVERWLDALAERLAAQVETIGHSVQGRPLRLLAFGNPDAREAELVIGRQHPPEVTGMRAQMA